MDVEAMRAAVTLAEELHFGRTAARLHLDPGGLTKRIQRLERSVGARLFARTSRRVGLTAAGERFVFEARAVLEDLDDLGARLRQRPAGGVLRVGVLGFGIAETWAEVRGAILDVFPDARFHHIELDVSTQYAALRGGLVDVALVHYVGPVDCLDVTPVLAMSQVAVVPRTAPEADADLLTRDELSAMAWVGYAVDDPGFSDWAGPAHPDRADRSVRSPSTMVAAVATTGRAGIHGAAAMRYYARPEVAFVPVEGSVCEVAVATRRDDHNPLVEAARAGARLVDARRQPAGIVAGSANDLPHSRA